MFYIFTIHRNKNNWGCIAISYGIITWRTRGPWNVINGVHTPAGRPKQNTIIVKLLFGENIITFFNNDLSLNYHMPNKGLTAQKVQHVDHKFRISQYLSGSTLQPLKIYRFNSGTPVYIWWDFKSADKLLGVIPDCKWSIKDHITLCPEMHSFHGRCTAESHPCHSRCLKWPPWDPCSHKCW